jgi:hypothetical protein
MAESDAGADAGGSTGNAGAAGEGGSAEQPDCSLHVRGDETSIQSAIDRAPVPGVVCIDAGLYQQTVTLRDGVSLRGSGESTAICGELGVPQLALGATIERLSLGGVLRVTSPSSALTVRDFSRPELLPGCGSASGPSIAVDLSGGGALELEVERAVLEPSGVALESAGTPAAPVHLALELHDSRCAGSQCYDFLSFSVGFPSGSSVHVALQNNVMARVALEAIAGSLDLDPDDRVSSELTLTHNTIFALDEANAAIYWWNGASLPIRARGNAIASFQETVRFGAEEAAPSDYDLGGNVAGFGASAPNDPRWYDTWFVDADGNDFRPAPGSPLIGAADPDDDSVDIDGVPRTGRSDSGAYQATTGTP